MRKHFQALLNRAAGVDESMFNKISQRLVIEELAEPPTLLEMEMSTGKMERPQAMTEYRLKF